MTAASTGASPTLQRETGRIESIANLPPGSPRTKTSTTTPPDNPRSTPNSTESGRIPCPKRACS